MDVLENLFNNFSQNDQFGPQLGKADEFDHTFPYQKCTAAASDWATSPPIQCIKLITPLTYLIPLISPEVSTSWLKGYCSLGRCSVPYCIGRLTMNLNISRKKATKKLLVQKIEEWIRKTRMDILLRPPIQFPNLFAVVRIKFSSFQCDIKWSCKLGLDFQLKNLFIFPVKTFKFQQSN